MKKLIALIAAMVMVSSMAYAADWNFFGSARISTFYTSTDANTAGVADVDTYSQGLQGNSRFGASVKVSDELTGGFEYGTGVNVRKLYGEWNFGAGSFLVGQTYTPLNMFYSNQVFAGDTDMLSTGGVYSGRAGMLRLKFGDFQIALVNPNETNVAGVGYTEVDFPTIEAKYVYKADMFSVQLAGGYNSYEIVAPGVTYDIDSYVIALGARATFGAGYIGGNVFTGENAGNLIWLDTGGPVNGMAAISGNTVLDNDVMGYLIVAGYKVNDMFSLEAGYSKLTTELDGIAGVPSVDDDAAAYYAQATITLAPGVFFIPEVGVLDHDEAGQTEISYFGCKWQINF